MKFSLGISAGILSHDTNCNEPDNNFNYRHFMPCAVGHWRLKMSQEQDRAFFKNFTIVLVILGALMATFMVLGVMFGGG